MSFRSWKMRKKFFSKPYFQAANIPSFILKFKTMKPKKDPTVGQYYDEEEKALIEAIESDDYQTPENRITEAEKIRLQQIARNTINEERTKISIRIPKSDLSRLKAQALHEGILYQTLINSILHKATQS